MNGAVQGEATAAASTPVRKESSVGSRARSDGDPRGQQRAELEDAGEIEADEREQRRERDHGARRLQLEPPAELLTAGTRRDQQAGEREKRQHHARGVGPGSAHALARVAGMLGERENLQ